MKGTIIALIMGANSIQLNRPGPDMFVQVGKNATEAAWGTDHHDLTYSPMV